jgi:hypothetical protein
MVFKRMIGLVFAGGLLFSAAAADIVVRIGPPRNVSERRGRQPSRNHVWVNGYQRWDGNAYAWSPGRWEQRPEPRSRWVAHRWTHEKGNKKGDRQGGWVFSEGHWR